MTDTSQRTDQKLSACLVALDRHTILGLMLGVDSLALTARMVPAPLVGGQIVAALVLTALAVTGGLAALAIARLYPSVTRYPVWSSLAFASTGLLLLAVALGLCASRAGLLAPWSFALCFGAASTTCLWLSRLCVCPLFQLRHTPHVLPVAFHDTGDAGAQLARVMASSGEFRPACLFDEKRAFTPRRTAGLEVFPVSALQEQVARHSTRSIVIALPSSSPLRMPALTRKLVQTGVLVRWFQNLLDMHKQGEARRTLSQIRLKHLLGRIVEGIRDNVLGSVAIAHAAHERGVATCVLVSIGKAVCPTDVMNASKRIAEPVFQAAAAVLGTVTRFSMVRFGNVLGSSGPLVPLLQQDMPRNALDPDGDIEIGFIGLYPGEKLCEELLIGDGAEPDDYPPAILRVREQGLVDRELTRRIEQLLLACQSNERRHIDTTRVALVPEFRTAPNGPPGLSTLLSSVMFRTLIKTVRA